VQTCDLSLPVSTIIADWQVPPVLHQGDTLADAIQMMVASYTQQLVMLEEQRIVGILCIGDLFRFFFGVPCSGIKQEEPAPGQLHAGDSLDSVTEDKRLGSTNSGGAAAGGAQTEDAILGRAPESVEDMVGGPTTDAPTAADASADGAGGAGGGLGLELMDDGELHGGDTPLRDGLDELEIGTPTARDVERLTQLEEEEEAAAADVGMGD